MELADFKQRFLIALILLMVLSLALLSVNVFALLLTLVGSQLIRENYNLLKNAKISTLTMIISIFVTALLPLVLLWLWYNEHGLTLVASVLIVAIAADCGGYIIGKIVKGPKLYSSVSPNKTIAGAIGAVIAASIITPWLNVFLWQESMFLAICAVAADLVASKFKRILVIKDFGNLLPGHGGLYDRLDSHIGVVYGVLVIINL